MKYVLLFLSGAFFVSCSVINSDERPEWVSIAPKEVEVVQKSAQNVSFKMQNNCVSYCLKDFAERIERTGNTYHITTIAKPTNRSKNAGCPEVCFEVTRNYSVSVTESGQYTFQFIHRGQVYQEIELTF